MHATKFILSLLSPLSYFISTLYPFSLSKYYHNVYFSIFRTAHVAGHDGQFVVVE